MTLTRSARPDAESINIPLPVFPGRGLCADSEYPPDLWHAEGYDKAARETRKQAKAICRQCPIQVACLTHALKNTEFGVWGGTTELERKELLKGNH